MKKILSVVCVMAFLAGLLAACQNTPSPKPTTDKTTQSTTTRPTLSIPTAVSTTISAISTTNPISSPTTKPTTTQADGTTTVPTTPSVGPSSSVTTKPITPSVGPSSSVTTKPSTKPSGGTTTVPTVPVTPTAPTTKPALKLPYEIPGTGLIIEEMRSYDGIYVEDGTNNSITGVAMILLRNLGKKDIDFAEITMHYGDLTRQFVVTSLPKGMSVVVQEKNRNPVASGKLEKCSASVIEAVDAFQLSPGQISITEKADNSLVIKNLTGKDLPSVRVFYKYFMEEEQLLVGGVTFTSNVTDLKAGQSATIKPAHYLTGASTVVMVQIYEVAV